MPNRLIQTAVHQLRFVLPALFAANTLAAEHYTIDAAHTWPSFEVNHLGYSTQRGRFNQTHGKITLDVAAKTGMIDITIDAGSIDMGFQKWDEHMKSPDFFHVQLHPTIRFYADELRFEEEKLVGAKGYLTLLGTRRAIELSIANFHCAPHPLNRRRHCGADVTSRIQRTQFGMAKYVPMIGDEVKLVIPVEADLDQE
ncbi:YceI family protein [Ferrigenium sp. UT4]